MNGGPTVKVHAMPYVSTYVQQLLSMLLHSLHTMDVQLLWNAKNYVNNYHSSLCTYSLPQTPGDSIEHCV